MRWAARCTAYCVERRVEWHDVLGGQLGSTLRSILCLAIDWAVCCVEPHDEQHLCLADRQHLRWAARCTAYCDGQYVVLSGMMGGMIYVGRPVE